MLALRNGTIIDGTGGAPYTGTVLVDGDRISLVDEHASADTSFDCEGLAISPGFFDLHSHSDIQALDPARREKIKQGVTAELVGNCGFSAFPIGDDAGQLREFARGIFCEADGWGWREGRDYVHAAAESRGATHVYSLAGHGSLRVAVAGMRQSITAEERRRMLALLEEALDAGCSGFSTGLMYAPGSAADLEELIPLLRAVAKHGKLYATHMRSYSAGLVDAVREQIELARRTGCRLQISHLQAAGRSNWDLLPTALAEIEAAAREGIDVEFDIYPYQCGSTVLTQSLPDDVLDGGLDAMCTRLADPALRLRIADEVEASIPQSWDDITITGVASDGNASFVGQTLAEIARVRGERPVDTMLWLLAQERGRVNVVAFNQSEANLRALLTHPLCSVISDGFYVRGLPHPRLHGTFPELLGRIVREKGWMTLAEAVHKITSKPLARLGRANRGVLTDGAAADLVVFDPERTGSPATYREPDQDPTGIRAVFRSGKLVAGEWAGTPG